MACGKTHSGCQTFTKPNPWWPLCVRWRHNKQQKKLQTSEGAEREFSPPTCLSSPPSPSSQPTPSFPRLPALLQFPNETPRPGVNVNRSTKLYVRIFVLAAEQSSEYFGWYSRSSDPPAFCVMIWTLNMIVTSTTAQENISFLLCLFPNTGRWCPV